MKVRNVQSVICLVIFFLFANQAWAENWIKYEESKTGHMYYDKSSIKEVNKNFISVWTLKVYNKDGKAKDFSMLKGKNKAPNNADILDSNSIVAEFDCVNKKFRVTAWTIYDKEKHIIYSAPKFMNKWESIVANSSSEKLKNIVCHSDKTSKTKKK